jgi:O-antigen/teichoic acid export membrane protein
VLILVFILFFVFRWISFGQFLPLFVIATAIPALLMVASLFRNPEFAVHPFIGDAIREKRKMMASVGVYGILIGFSGMVITNIDRIMVERMMGLGSTGVYTTMAYFATMVIIPSRALLKISDPVLAQSWKDSDLGNVRDNYYRSAISQFLIGSLILIGLWVNIDNILRILPEEFADGKFVILFIGLAFLVDMSSGTATYILANSVYYKYQTYYIMGLVVLIIATNFVLIPVWGLTGAATSTFISKMIINLMRHRLIYSKFGLQPYTLKFLYVVAIAMAAYGTGYLVPAFDSLVVDIGVRSAVTGTVFIALTLIFRISPEFAERLREVYGRVRRRK